MAAHALFRRDGRSTFVPTSAAVGPWDQGIVHGAAIAALFAGQLSPTDLTLARLTIEYLRPVPMAPLTLERHDPEGGARVQRQDAVLTCAGTAVAAGRSVAVRRGELDLPERALARTSPFAPDTAPALDQPNRAAAQSVGWDSFDSTSLIFERMRVEDDPRTHQWISLAVPVLEGTELRGVELAAAAADYGQSAVNRQLPIADWSFRNAELTVHLTREPVGPWIGMRCEALVQPVGAGYNAAELFDAAGAVGRSAAALVVERRGAP